MAGPFLLRSTLPSHLVCWHWSEVVFIAERMKMVSLPEGIGWKAITGIACLAGVGFTMSLFIGTLAFADPANATYVRIGVLSGSTVSGILGIVLLKIALARMKAEANMKASTAN